jgi:hypothetical protein
MFCVHCGAAGAVAFCAACGKRQITSTTGSPEHDKDDDVLDAIVAELDWVDSIQYETLLANPEPRERIAAAAARRSTPGVTSEDLLTIFDAVSPIGFSLSKLSTAIVPISDKLGFKTGKQSQAVFDAPPGRVLLAVLCTLARKSLEIAEVQQAPERCALTAEIPSGLVTNRGRLSALVEQFPGFVQVSLRTHIMGQWYDWGKSSRMLDELLSAIHSDLTEQRQGQPPRFRRVA